MGTCIICGKSVDGRICSTHEQDVAFEFRGTRPDQLVTGRYYRGTVDGYADFGVFVDVGESVTGLLHRSEVPSRLDSLDWEPGDEVFVEVTGVHDNGNVDLGWSIRQSAEEFRGHLVHDPTADPAEFEAESDETASEPEPTTDAASDRDEAPSGNENRAAQETSRTAETDSTPESDTPAALPARVAVESLGQAVGDRVRVEGEVTAARQTSGPTVFELTDETGTVDCAAFEAAGVRAYPEVETGDVVSLVGEVERRRGALQVETERLDVLSDEARLEVERRLDAALSDRARPPSTALLADDSPVEEIHDGVVAAATAVRRAVFEGRPVVLRHTATVDGYVAAAAIERAVLPLIRETRDDADAAYHQVERRPVDDPFYGVEDATRDLSGMLDDAQRHDEPHPLVVLVDAGSTRESLDGLDLLGTYDVRRAVLDGAVADPEVDQAVDVLVTPESGTTTSAAVAANVAAHVNPDVRADMAHLPAIPNWERVPAPYADLASGAGYDRETLGEIRDAVALEAFYQTHEDKRELMEDLFWSDRNRSLAAYVASQFRARLDTAVRTAEPHRERRAVEGTSVTTLDVAAFTHERDFPPVDLLLDELHRREREDADGAAHVTLGVGEDELRARSTDPVSLRDVAAEVATACPEASVRACGDDPGAGYVEFLRGERDAVREAAVDAVAAATEPAAPAEE
ncbi:MAG: OB-fold nucleic acid binding domain-containing protein [Halobacteriaceae archaeon]